MRHHIFKINNYNFFSEILIVKFASVLSHFGNFIVRINNLLYNF